MEIKQAAAAGRTVGEVGFNALIVSTQIVRTLIAALIIATLIIAALIDYAPISSALISSALISSALISSALIGSALIVHTLTSHMLIGGALMLITLCRVRSRTGSSVPVVFNLSTAQMLRLFSHWTHISLI
jgi:hypothetical protein